jgi:hypothetical protein
MPKESARDLNATTELPEVLAEREACANLLELTNSEIRLMAGEISPDEMRTIQAILSWRVRIIRARKT